MKEIVSVSSDLFDLEPSYLTFMSDNNNDDGDLLDMHFCDNSVTIATDDEDNLINYTLELVQIMMMNGVDDFNVKRPIMNELTL